MVTTVVLSHQIKWGNVLGCLFIYSPKEDNLLVSASTQKESSGESQQELVSFNQEASVHQVKVQMCFK